MMRIASVRMRRLRSMPAKPPAVASTATRTSSMTTVSGVNTRVRTGAMFSTTCCLASTSQMATTRPRVLTGESDTIHAPPVGPPPHTGASQLGQQPQNNRGVQCGEYPYGAARGERVEVEHNRQAGKRNDQCCRHGPGNSTFPRKVRRQEGENEQPQIARQGRAVDDPAHAGLNRHPAPTASARTTVSPRQGAVPAS
jgi:hypothetical protein